MEEKENLSPKVQRSPRLDVRVAVLEDRVERVQTDVKQIADKLEAAVDRIERSITEIKDKPNPVAQFLNEHWKTIVVAVAALMGANATVLDFLTKLT